ncbi:hypothetical protein BH09VER1_BH09VER1_49460 [soil metagenome]
MTHTIIVNDKEFAANDWLEAPSGVGAAASPERHMRDQNLLENGVDSLSAGEVYFHCDLTLVFDTAFELKGDGRKFVVIASNTGKHVAKPY